MVEGGFDGCPHQGDGAPGDGACSEAATAEEFAGHCGMVDGEVMMWCCFLCMHEGFVNGDVVIRSVRLQDLGQWVLL